MRELKEVVHMVDEKSMLGKERHETRKISPKWREEARAVRSEAAREREETKSRGRLYVELVLWIGIRVRASSRSKGLSDGEVALGGLRQAERKVRTRKKGN